MLTTLSDSDRDTSVGNRLTENQERIPSSSTRGPSLTSFCIGEGRREVEGEPVKGYPPAAFKASVIIQRRVDDVHHDSVAKWRRTSSVALVSVGFHNEYG